MRQASRIDIPFLQPAERVGKLSVDQMAHPARTFNALTGEEIVVNAGNVSP